MAGQAGLGYPALFGRLPCFSASGQLVPRLLIVHHTPSPYTQELFEAVLAGATDPDIEGVEVVRRPALTVSPADMLAPASLGYMSGALKHYSVE